MPTSAAYTHLIDDETDFGSITVTLDRYQASKVWNNITDILWNIVGFSLPAMLTNNE